MEYVDGRGEQGFVLQQLARHEMKVIYRGLKGLVRETTYGFELVSPFTTVGIGKFRTIKRQDDGAVVLDG